MSILITADELADALASARPPVLLDVRWSLDRPDRRSEYLAGHLPGAVHVSLERELADHGEPQDGRHPLPRIEALQASARAWGLHDGDAVVVYDDAGNLSAARAWWLLRAAGVADVRMLDGALPAWVASGRALEPGEVVPPPGDVSLAYGSMPTVDLDGAAAFPARGALLDARAGARYRGETEPIDPRAGHIPGALSAPTGRNLDEQGRFLPAATLRERFLGLGVPDGGDVAVYCGSGVTAAHEIAALAVAGWSAALYPGSWSQWANHPDRPVATGPEPA
jgi:thiosulfate/3-mercaptopyruvate sulfurtransferase